MDIQKEIIENQKSWLDVLETVSKELSEGRSRKDVILFLDDLIKHHKDCLDGFEFIINKNK